MAKFQIAQLGNPAVAMAAAKLASDKELRAEVRSDVGKVLKFVGFTALGIAVFIATKKIVKAVKNRRENKEQEAAITDTELTYPVAWYTQQAANLKEAMPDGFFANYNETDILRILGYLKNSSDFYKLSKAYGKDGGGRNLMTALSKDDEIDVKKYAEILKKIGISL